MDVTSAINQIQDIWLAIDGIRQAPDTPPDMLGTDLIAVTYELEGEVDVSAPYSDRWSPQKGKIVSMLLTPHKDLKRDVAKIMSYRDPFLRAIQDDPNLGGFLMMVTRLSWTTGPLEWNGVKHVGTRFVFEFDLELSPS